MTGKAYWPHWSSHTNLNLTSELTPKGTLFSLYLEFKKVSLTYVSVILCWVCEIRTILKLSPLLGWGETALICLILWVRNYFRVKELMNWETIRGVTSFWTRDVSYLGLPKFKMMWYFSKIWFICLFLLSFFPFGNYINYKEAVLES